MQVLDPRRQCRSHLIQSHRQWLPRGQLVEHDRDAAEDWSVQARVVDEAIVDLDSVATEAANSLIP